MPCYHPLDAKLSPSGKPIFKNATNYGRFTKLIKLPCGRCIGCKLDRSKTWAIRLMHEAQYHEEKSFVTLTIDKQRASGPPAAADAAPAGRRSRSQRGIAPPTDTHAPSHAHIREESLSSRDLQLLTARLREQRRARDPSTKMKYYAVGEYGENYQRPHYHIALFGEEFRDDRYEWRHEDSGSIYRSSRLERLWPYGNSEIGTLTFKSAAYVARYITKKLTPGRTAESEAAYNAAYLRQRPDGTIYEIEREFALVSNGIGKQWFAQYHRDVYPHDYVVMEGKKLKPPRYYDQLLAIFDELEAQQIKEERERKNLIGAKDNTPERLRAKEAVATAKLLQNTRKLG